MPRPRRHRRVWQKPGVTYFKPAGIRMIDLDESVLTVDEYESVRLKDMLGLDQKDAADRMKISQPTFHRLLVEARRKLADAIVNGKAIRIEGGVYKMARGFGGPGGDCVCPACGFQEMKQRGVPCVTRKCPKCGTGMVRG